MSSEEFEKLHEMFRSLFEELKLVPERLPSSSGEEKRRLLRSFEERRSEAEEVLQGMQEELRAAPASFRSGMSTKLRMYHRDLDKLQRNMSGLSTKDGRPQGIYSSQALQSTNLLHSQRALLLQGSESLNNASQSIERSQRIAAQTEQIGTDVIEELGEQREQLDRTRNRLVNTGENLGRTRKILRAMTRRLMTNKLLLAVIILMEVAILGAVVYLKFFRR